MDLILEQTTAHAKKLFDEVSETLGTDKFIIAGGCLRNFVEEESAKGLEKTLNEFGQAPTPSDIDVFMYDPTVWQDTKDRLLSSGYEITKERSRSAVFYKHKSRDIDLVLLEGAIIGEDVIRDFDFTNCCIAYDKGGLTTHDMFFPHVTNRELKVNNVKLPYHTLLRASKFHKKGYTLDTDTRLALFDQALLSSISSE